MEKNFRTVTKQQQYSIGLTLQEEKNHDICVTKFLLVLYSNILWNLNCSFIKKTMRTPAFWRARHFCALYIITHRLRGHILLLNNCHVQKNIPEEMERRLLSHLRYLVGE